MEKLQYFLVAICCSLLVACNPVEEPKPDTKPEEGSLPEVKRDFDVLINWFEVAVKKTHPNIQKAWNTDANPDDFNLLLVNDDRSRICAITPDGKQEWKKSDWPEEIRLQVEQMNSFACTYANNKSYTLIWCNYEDFDRIADSMKPFGVTMNNKDMAFHWLELFYHESFHEFVQRSDKGWKKTTEAYNRDQSYPIDYSPRIYRKLALIALKNAWKNESGKADSYARAKYWTDKYEKTYPNEAIGIKSTDIDEATAEFFARNVVNMAFPDSYTLIYDIDTYNLGRGLDAESYMSSIAIQLLRREGRMDEAISTFKAQNLTPVNCLLKDIPVPANYDESQDAQDSIRIRRATEQTIGDENPIVKPVAEIMKSHKEGKNIYLGMMEVNGSYTSSQGSYTLSEITGFYCFVNFQISSDFYEIKGQTIMYSNGYDLAPVSDMSHLVLTDSQTASTPIPPLSSVSITTSAKLTQVTGEEFVEIKKLPVNVLIGKDSYGNTYVFCDFKKQ